MPNTKKSGRRKSDRLYRQNVVRIGVVEDMLERMLEQLHTNSSLRKIVKKELSDLRMRESEKVDKRLLDKVGS
ncbi:hypothetical protein [Priestia megaterium]|uniref:hypothetical protein n=1 Tax=Priestia megaterium TaxID=1404 RepID=UPI003CFF6C6E